MKQESFFARILYSQQLGMKILKGLLIFSFVVLGIGGLRVVVQSLKPPLLYRRDLLQEYLLAKAVLAGVDPYLPLPSLAARFFPGVQATFLPHPTPYPPPIALLGLPLALMSYQDASIFWLVVEILCLGGIWWEISRWLGMKLEFFGILLGTLMLVGWRPVLEELVYGQLMIVLLLFLVGSGLLLHLEKPLGAGALLGVVLSLKFLGWPLLIFWAIRKQWRVIVAALGVLFGLNLFAIFLMKLNVVWAYYTQVGAEVAPLYQGFAFNFSPWTLGWRLFAGTGSPVLVSIEAPPLIPVPQIASYVSLLLSGLVFIGGMALALRARTQVIALTILMCLSILVNPVTWIHYFTWTFPPLVVLAKRLRIMGLPLGKTSVSLLIFLILALPGATLTRLAQTLSGNLSHATFQVSFLASLVTLVQPLAVIGLMLLLCSVDQTRHCMDCHEDVVG